jgi:hypothetical protein
MRAVSKAANAARDIAQDLDDALYGGWGDVFHEELDGLDPKQELNILQGSKLYKNVTPSRYLHLTRNRPLFRKVMVLGKDDNRILAVIANRVVSRVAQLALGHRDTGEHMDSIAVFIREVGETHSREHRGFIRAADLPDRAVVQIVPIVKYASALESILYGFEGEGIVHQAAKEARRRHRTNIAVRYDYIDGVRLGENGGTFPRLSMGFYGNLRPALKTPGRSRK